MAIFKKGAKNETKSDDVVIPPSNQPIGPHSVLGVDASADEDRVPFGTDPVADEIAALEDAVTHDPQMAAAEAAERYELVPGAASLLARSLDSLATADGANIPDAEFKLSVQNRAALLSATDNDLPLAIACIVDTMRDDPGAIAGTVYNLTYAVMKQSVFFANLDYRRFLDPRGDFDLAIYRHPGVGDDYDPETVREALGHEFAADQREELRDAPLGLPDMVAREWNYFSQVYGSTVETTDDIFAASLSDLRTFLQLINEAYGWDPERPMPYANMMNPDGTFTPITDPEMALDHQQVVSAARRRERQIKQATAMGAAAERAKAILLQRAKR
jgi:hypothetical protein